MNKYYQLDENYKEGVSYTLFWPNKYHNLKEKLPATNERFFAVVIDKKRYGNSLRLDTIEIMEYPYPMVGYRIKFGDGCVEYDKFCKDENRCILWLDIDYKVLSNALLGVDNLENPSEIERVFLKDSYN